MKFEKICKELHLSYENISEHFNVKLSTVRAWHKGKLEPPPAIVKEIEEWFSVLSSSLFEGEQDALESLENLPYVKKAYEIKKELYGQNFEFLKSAILVEPEYEYAWRKIINSKLGFFVEGLFDIEAGKSKKTMKELAESLGISQPNGSAVAQFFPELNIRRQKLKPKS